MVVGDLEEDFPDPNEDIEAVVLEAPPVDTLLHTGRRPPPHAGFQLEGMEAALVQAVGGGGCGATDPFAAVTADPR